MFNHSLVRRIVLAFLPVLLSSVLFQSPQAPLSNGAFQPQATPNIFIPFISNAPVRAAAAPFVLAAVGDGAAGTTQAGLVSDMLVSWNPNLFMYLGDVYEQGTSAEFQNNYGTNTYFGRLKAVTKPVLGNHELLTPGAAGYFEYWNNIPQYYSFDANGWHIIALNSNTSGAVGSAQYNWLAQDLAAHPSACTIAAFHHPVFNVGEHSPSTRMPDSWALLARSGADIVLTGHDHNYQRWRPLDENGSLSTTGTTQFVVGGGGRSLYRFTTSDSRLAKGFDSAPNGYGALRLELNAQAAVFQYINSQGAVLDSGTIPCSGTTAATATPTATGTTTPGTYIFTPEADAYVDAGSPGSNYGASTSLRADSSPHVRSYLRFRVQGLVGQVTSVQLRIYANSASSTGFNLRKVTDQTWGENLITYNNAPGVGSLLGSSGSINSGSWTTVNVTGLVSGNGVVSLALGTSSSSAISFSSREGSRPPQLIVQTSTSGSTTPTPTATPLPPTPTRTASPTPTRTPSASSTPGMVSFTSDADSYTYADSPSTNYGTVSVLRIDASPVMRSYVRFTIQGISAPVTRARLRLYANTSSSAGLTVARTASTWSETGITYSNAPAAGSAVGSVGAFSGGAWVEIDVTSYVTGNGVFSFVVSTPGSTAVSLSSREGANDPTLVIESGP